MFAGMVETDPQAKEPAISRRRAGKKALPSAEEARKKTYSADDLRNAPTARTKAANYRSMKTDATKRRVRDALESGADKEEEKEATKIYLRINRELAAEEARADRLLRLYSL